jgi:hypothetical protein
MHKQQEILSERTKKGKEGTGGSENKAPFKQQKKQKQET